MYDHTTLVCCVVMGMMYLLVISQAVLKFNGISVVPNLLVVLAAQSISVDSSKQVV